MGWRLFHLIFHVFVTHEEFSFVFNYKIRVNKCVVFRNFYLNLHWIFSWEFYCLILTQVPTCYTKFLGIFCVMTGWNSKPHKHAHCLLWWLVCSTWHPPITTEQEIQRWESKTGCLRQFSITLVIKICDKRKPYVDRSKRNWCWRDHTHETQVVLNV